MLGSIILKYFKPSIIASRLVRYNTYFGHVYLATC